MTAHPQIQNARFPFLLSAILFPALFIAIDGARAQSLFITSLAVINITSTSADIEWTVSDFATGQVEYGPTASYGSRTIKETSFNFKTHRQTLSNLSPDTTYHYRITSTNQAGETAQATGSAKTTAGGTTGGAWNGRPTPPQAPKDYNIPAGALRVTDSTGLKTALARTPALDIVLANGTYDNGSAFQPAAPHRLWAENLGGATLAAGIVFNSGAGAEVHGIRFDVNNSSKTSNDSIIYTSGSAHRLTVTDSWFEGNKTVGWGMHFQASDGIQVHRAMIRQFTRNGLEVDGWPHFASPPPNISDLDVRWIRDPDPRCCNGTAEFGVQLRAVLPGSIVERVRTRWVDWSCFLPIDAKGGVWRDLDCDWSQQPFYFEHFVDDSVVERFWFGPHSGGGIIIEPALPNWNWKPSGQHITIQDGQIESRRYGVEIGVCNGDTTVQRVKFVGQCLAAISDNTFNPYGQGHCTAAGPNRFINNDYSQILPSAKDILVNSQVHGGQLCEDQWWQLYNRFP